MRAPFAPPRRSEPRNVAAEAQAGPDSGITYEENFAIVVTCDSESDQAEKYDALMALGYACKVLVN